MTNRSGIQAFAQGEIVARFMEGIDPSYSAVLQGLFQNASVDVAVISKSDGFVWIKRKHYFKKELNPQFDINYMREIERGKR
jgi:hypothetical protein